MGYYTHFQVSFDDESDEVVKYIEQFQDSEDWQEKYFYDVWTGRADTEKWYYHEDFMKKLSKKFPDVVFDLYGEGEMNEDVWHKYFKDGKVQIARARIEFDPYDPAKLK